MLSRLEELTQGFLSIAIRPLSFNYKDGVDYVNDFKWFAAGLSLAYLISIFAIKTVMANRKAFELTSLLHFWNAWLAAFSLLGSVVVGFQLAADVFTQGFDATVCETTPVWHDLSGYMQWIFALSKIAEFGDTFLIVLRKKPLIFLHWYHHVMTMNYALFSYPAGQGYNAWIVWLNLTVHAVMYSYYLLKSAGFRVPAWVAQIITSSQIFQFLSTLLIQARAVQLYRRDECPQLNEFIFGCYQESVDYAHDFKWFAAFLSIAYVVAIFSLQAFMVNKKAFQLKSLLHFWNAWLAIFSLIGAAIIGWQLATDFFTLGFDATVCETTSVWHGLSGYMQLLFGLSKIAEFGDTFLIVLRKRPLIFLHWYHHVMTLNYAMFSYPFGQGYNAWIVWLNLTVHAVMYSYYMLKSAGVRVPAWVAQIITSSQIFQFLATLLIQARAVQLYRRNECAEFNEFIFGWCLLMELSYVALFGHFFYESYLSGGRKNKYLKEKETPTHKKDE
ncbi:unnamed protein product, partial [Mesorhabditis spiculigera]